VDKPWAELVEAHRHDTREAILDAVAALVAEHGPHGVTMGGIAAKAGLSQTRLCRYFGDLHAVMRAWHDRQLGSHLGYLDGIGAEPGTATQRLDAVLRAYAAMLHQTHQHHTTELGAALHRDEAVVRARRHLHDQLRDLIAEGVRSGEFRDDLPPDELAERCLRDMSTAGAESSAGAIRQLVTDTVARLRDGR
jgi:AcrR family transcriptional regulator